MNQETQDPANTKVSVATTASKPAAQAAAHMPAKSDTAEHGNRVDRGGQAVHHLIPRRAIEGTRHQEPLMADLFNICDPKTVLNGEDGLSRPYAASRHGIHMGEGGAALRLTEEAAP